MPIPIFTSKKRLVTQPLLNEFSKFSIDDMQRFIARKIMQQIQATPELVSIIDTVITDHFMGDIDFFNSDGKQLGPTLLKNAKQKWIDLKVDEAFYGAGADYFANGQAFGWHASFNDELSAKQRAVLDSFDDNLANMGFQDVAKSLASEPRKISYLSASTTEIQHDEFGVISYKQDATGSIKIWPREQVVDIKLMNMDGRVRGFSGIKALSKEIALMFMVKENLFAKLQNGGSMDNIIYMKNKVGAGGASKARFERLRTALESFSHLKKSHGNMPIDTEVGVVPLGTSLKDMEYQELAMFLISEFALAVGVPSSRLTFLMTGSGGNANKGEMSTQSEDAYQKKINSRRRRWENAWNPVFAKLGFHFKFRRDNLQDEIRETGASVQRTAYAEKIQSLLMAQEKELTMDALLQLISGTKKNINNNDIQEIPAEKLAKMEQANNPDPLSGDKNGFKQTSNTESKSRLSNQRSDAKKATASNNGVHA